MKPPPRRPQQRPPAPPKNPARPVVCVKRLSTTPSAPGKAPAQTVCFVGPVSKGAPSGLSPTGGPANGPFSNGNVPAPSPSPAPAPPVPPSCVTASIFTDCFPCTGGPINGGAPGPVCGWTFSEAFGPKGGQVTFTPGVMSLDGLGGGSNTPGAGRPFPSPLGGVTLLSTQFKFTEYPGSAGTAAIYHHFIFDSTFSNFIQVFMNATGLVLFIAGPAAGADSYSGTWVPDNGTHKVDYSIDALGVPTLYIDDVLIPLVFGGGGNTPPFGSTFSADTIYFLSEPGGAFVISSKVMDVFVTAGIQPPTTAYCCP